MKLTDLASLFFDAATSSSPVGSKRSGRISNCHACLRLISRSALSSTIWLSRSISPVKRWYCSIHASSIVCAQTSNIFSASTPKGTPDFFLFFKYFEDLLLAKYALANKNFTDFYCFVHKFSPVCHLCCFSYRRCSK